MLLTKTQNENKCLHAYMIPYLRFTVIRPRDIAVAEHCWPLIGRKDIRQIIKSVHKHEEPQSIVINRVVLLVNLKTSRQRHMLA